MSGRVMVPGARPPNRRAKPHLIESVRYDLAPIRCAVCHWEGVVADWDAHTKVQPGEPATNPSDGAADAPSPGNLESAEERV